MIKVYLVEDQALVRDAVAALLSLDFNIEVIGQASNGQDALTAITNLIDDSMPDIILTDIEMPNMNGIEATEQIKAMFAGKQMPIVIALTADAFEVDNATWFKHGLTELLTKPFDAKALCSVIARALSKRRQKG